MTENQYSIKDLEHFTQIKSHTIRIWEQRYNLLQPSRTDGNRRFYTDKELKKILNINLLYTNGFKISKIAEMSEDEMLEHCKNLILTKNNPAGFISEMIQKIIEFDRISINQLLEEELRDKKTEDVYLSSILPLLEKMGELWQVNTINVIHEHFFSYILREKLLAIINALPEPHIAAPKALLFLHANEEHEFSLLMYYYILKSKGYSCIYLGQKVPFHEVVAIVDRMSPKYVISTFTAKISEEEFENLCEGFLQISHHSTVLISGAQLHKFEKPLPAYIQHVDQLKKLEAVIQ